MKNNIVEMVQKLGISTVLLIFAFWWFTSKVAEPMISSHTQFLQAQVETSHIAAQTLERLSRVVEGQAACLTRIEDCQRESQKQHAEMLEKLSRSQTIGQAPVH